MEMRHLRTFVIAAELQSFTRAAEALGLTQAAISQHVAALEKDLAMALFDRGPRSVTLTDTGRRVYEHARTILKLVDDIHQEAGQSQSEVSGTIRIACSTVPSEWLLPELLVKFREIYPEVRESVSVSDSTAAIHAVESGAAEVGLVGELPRAANLCAKSIAQDELTLVVAPDHEFARRKGIKPGDLRGQPLIVREPDSGSRRCIEQALSKAGLATTDLRFSMEVNSNDAIRAAVERGVGISFLSAQAIAREIQDKRLISVDIKGVRAIRDLYLITDPQRLPTRVARAFLDFVDDWRRSADGQAAARLS
ncbi:MAG: LysR family transcriptional regulator [Planctomycetaceae bacterium]|nr:LysR family transcriptional regulator [Planctomycetales bacterium]MCB9920948.1 LysR family transcriptional regulator [Planctomycetaceae bacterium]